MKLPSTTSRLLALQQATNAELRVRLKEVFQRYWSLAFAQRNDNLFTEHWTPELAAAGYNFEGFEIKESEIVLHGVENACGLIYRTSIGFPVDLIDDAPAIEAYFQEKYTESKASDLFSCAQRWCEPSSGLKFPYDLNIG